MKANVKLVFSGHNREEQASRNAHVLLLLNKHGRILSKLPLGQGQYNYTLEVNQLDKLTHELWEFERHNAWLRVVKVSAMA